MKHNHRIVPGHMGGDYIEGNVISVEVTKCNGNTANHAMWHYANWLLYGKEEDKIAWKGLSGTYGKEEVIEELLKLARSRIDRKALGETLRKKFEENPELREERSKQILNAFEKLEREDPTWRESRRQAIASAGGAIKSVETRRREKIGMFDNEWQREMGRRGARKVVELRLGILQEGVYNDPIRKAKGGRASCLSRQGVKINGEVHYPESFGYRTNLSSDFVNYYIQYGLPKIQPSRRQLT